MEFLGNLAGQFTESPDEKMNKLKRKLEHLVSREHDVKVELEYAEQLLMKKPRKEVENWLQEVGRTKTEVQDLEARVKEGSKFKQYLTLSNSIDRYTTEVNQLIQRAVFSGGLTLQVCDSGVPLATTKLVGKKFQEIWERVMNDNISSIGVYGMGGIGKTTLITHIHDRLLHHQSRSVAWVTVSQNCSSCKLQDNIAKVLGLRPLDEKDERKRAAVLASALRKKENFVLILDDIWDYIKLDEVGIPANEIGCKLIITTRFLDVCRRMNCKEIIQVEPLCRKDAWELFQMHIGALRTEIEEIAKSLVNEFAGFPLGIILAAGCLRGVDDICQWNDALEQMKDPSSGQDELEFGKVFQVLKYSFDKLNPTLRQCFLYCALYPEDYHINREELIQLFIDEKLIHEMNKSGAELNRGHTILNKLENSCLLEGGKDRFGRKYVGMHDVVRDMAIKIASMNSPRFLVGVEATDKLEDGKLMVDVERMSLQMSNFDPEGTPHISPRCATLSTLLFFNLYSKSIPDCFFTHMNSLTVLDLSNSRIHKLPTSVYNLQCLTSLVLRGCYSLSYMSSLENLKALRRLDLRDSGITELPEGIDTLTNLRYLDLKCPIKVIPDGILCKLSHLQYLVFNHEKTFPIRGEEIASLRKLETLRASFLDLNGFDACVNSWKDGGPTDYSLAVVHDQRLDGDIGNGYDLTVNRAGEVLHAGTFSCLNSIVIVLLPDIKRLFTPALLYNLQNLEALEVGGCDKMVEIIEQSDELGDQEASSSISSALPNLRKLYLFELPELKSFCSNIKMDFPSLEDISIRECPKLKSFPHLSRNLERLVVVSCDQMVEIIELDAQEASSSISSTLPNLRDLELSKLLELKSFCNNIKMDFPSLKHIFIEECPKLKRFPHLFRNLERLQVRRCDQMVEIIELDAQEASSSISSTLPKLRDLELSKLPELKSFCSNIKMDFPSLKYIFIEECPKLKRFPHLFRNLERLEVRRCDQMVEIIEPSDELDDQEASSSISSSLPNLRNLYLFELPELKSVHSNIKMDFPSLEDISIRECLKLKSFPHLSRNLERLVVVSCDQMVEIRELDAQEASSSISSTLPNLRDLELSKLPELKSFCSNIKMDFPSLKHIFIEECPKLKRFPHLFRNLERLQIRRCDQMVEIIELDAQEASSSISSTLPNLRDLELSKLPELKSFCSNIKMDFPSLKHIFIEECPKLKRFPHLFRNLERLQIRRCDQMVEIIELDAQEASSSISSALPKLRDLELSKLPELKSFCNNIKMDFPSLKYIFIEECPKLKRFPHIFRNLERLEVRRCDQMVEIIEPSDELDAQEASSSISSTLPNLMDLKLFKLPELKSVHSNIKMDFPSLKHIYIKECPMLKRFPHLFRNLERLEVRLCDQMVEIIEPYDDLDAQEASRISDILSSTIPNLRHLELSKLPELKSFCSNIKMDFPSLKHINIEECPKLKRLPYRSRNLECLMITSCDQMVEIIELDAQEASLSISSILPNLSYLYLFELPELKCFCSNIKMDFPSLRVINIRKCPKLKRFPHLSRNLRVLVVRSCDQMVEIEPSDELDAQEASSSISSTLPNLKRLDLSNLPELKSFCSNIKMDFPSLKHIYIKECPKLIEECPKLKRFSTSTSAKQRSSRLKLYPKHRERAKWLSL